MSSSASRTAGAAAAAGTATTPLAPADNLEITTDVRSVYQSVLQDWLGNPDPTYERKYKPIHGLFV